MITVKIRYFAILREQRGLSEETLDTSAASPEQLYQELAARHQFSLPASQVRAAVNGEFVAGARPLQDRDEVVFIPPVAGG